MPKRNIIYVVGIVGAALVTLYVVRPREVYVSDPDAEEFRSVRQAYRVIRDEYSDPLEEGELRRGAVEGMVKRLDEFSTYIPVDLAEAFERRVFGGLQRGVGIELRIADGKATITRVSPNSPAHRERLFPGDEIAAIDGVMLERPTLNAIKKLLDGPLKTQVTLEVIRPGREAKTITLTRTEFPIESVEGLYRDDDERWVYTLDREERFQYVRIREFVTGTDERFRSVFQDYGFPRGLILDLRGCPGGGLEAAVRISDMFLSRGLIVTTVGRDGRSRRYQAHRDGTYPDIPMVVLVDGGTVSGGEVVCGSLRVHHRAALVGTRTRGKGCVQSIVSLGDDLGKISLTTSRFCLGPSTAPPCPPNSENCGVDPHVEVVASPQQKQQLAVLLARIGAIRRPSPKPFTDTAMSQHEHIVHQLLRCDAHLNRALQLLRESDRIEEILTMAAGAAELQEHPSDAENDDERN